MSDLVAYVDGELDGDEQAAVERALATDPEARERLRTFYRQRLILAQIAAQAVPERTPSGVSVCWKDRKPPSFSDGHVRRAARRRPRRRSAVAWALPGAALVAAVITLAIVLAPPRATGPVLAAIAGEVTVAGAADATAGRIGGRLDAGDRLALGEAARATLVWPDSTSVQLGPGARLAYDGDAAGVSLRLTAGALAATVAPQPAGRPFVVATPHARVVVKGTRLRVAVTGTATRLDVDEGLVSFVDRRGHAQDVAAGGAASAGDEPPVVPVRGEVAAIPRSPAASGRTLVDEQAVLAAVPHSAAGAQPGTVSVVATPGRPFARALRVTVPRQEVSPYADGEYALRLRVPLSAPPRGGEAGRVEAWLRAERTAQVRFVVERDGPPWTKSLDVPVVVGPEWTRVSIPLRFHPDAAAGRSEFQVWFGDRPAVVEIAGARLAALGGVASPPADPVADGDLAAWRDEARARVDRLRRGEVRVRVLGADGSPRAGVAVSAALRRGAFTVAAPLSPDSGAAYRDAALAHADEVVLESETKLPEWERDPSAAEAVIAEAQARGLTVRGHAPVWPRREGLGDHAERLLADAEALDRRLHAHVRSVVGTLAGRVASWDLVNDPYGSAEGMRVLGDQAIPRWFTAARAADADASLWLGCQGLLEHGGADRRRLEWYLTTVRGLGRQLDGLSLQARLRSPIPSGPALEGALDRIAACGLPLRIGEFDLADDGDGAAEAARDALLAFAAHRAVTGVTLWGFGWSRHDDPRIALLREDGSPTPMGRAILDQLAEWRAPAESATGSDGTCVLRPWRGTVRVTAGGTSRDVDLGTVAEVVLRLP